ncbi:MAG: adenylosuccinate synthase [Planctomycetota bacterium]
MSSVCVIGMQWGDEGKARIVDIFAREADIVVRTQGGANAGHTVVIGSEVYKLHQLPSGILRGKDCVIGNGVVFDPELFCQEIDELTARGIKIGSNLHVSDRAHVVLPYHKIQDALGETGGQTRLGTTGRGIGPCYTDKMARTGIRVCDFLDADIFREFLEAAVHQKNRLLDSYGASPSLCWRDIYDKYIPLADRVRPYVKDTSVYLNDALRAGRKILFEGAQGSLLDIDHGTYPYVTSSNASVTGVSAGAGISPKHVGKVVGVVKAYTTRVGEGPFPTELRGELGDLIRERGAEYGATTGRPRRCGWLDGVAIEHAARINGVDALTVTKLDVLDSIDRIKICRAYRINGKTIDRFPACARLLERAEPVYEEVDGWNTNLSQVRSYEELPRPTRDYLALISRLSGAEVDIVSVGPERSQTIFVKRRFF